MPSKGIPRFLSSAKSYNYFLMSFFFEIPALEFVSLTQACSIKEVTAMPTGAPLPL